MKNILKVSILLFILTLILNCDVTFNEELREYIDNIAARSPLDFSLSDSEVIDDNDSVNFGFTLTDKIVSCTITNNENVNIYLSEFTGIDGNFTVDAFDAFTLEPDSTFTFNVTYNSTSDNYNTRVSQEVKFLDEDNRPYTFYLWATSRTQPLSIYSEDDELLSVYDLGNWSDGRSQTFIIKNEGLQSLNVTSISTPADVTISSSTSFSMDINQEVEMTLGYNYNTTTVSGENLVVVSDYIWDTSGGKTFTLYAGGDVPITITDSSDTVETSFIFIGDYTSGSPIVASYTITNSSLFSMELSVSMDSDSSFTTTLENSIILDSDDIFEFQVSFLPTGDYGTKNVYIEFYDEESGRNYTLELYGNYSNI